MIPRSLTLLCLLASAAVLRGDNTPGVAPPDNPFLPAGVRDPGWRFIRGPNYDGHSPEIHLADAWPADGPPVLWTRELGQGYSAIVADAGRIYTQYQTLGGQFVASLDAETGRTLWEHRYDWPFEAAGVYPGPRATPTLGGEYVYFASPNGLIGCLRASDGRQIWTRNIQQDFRGRGTDFGYACSPTVVEGLVVMPVGGPGASLVALDANTGATVWQAGDEPASYTPAFPINWSGKRLVVGHMQNALILCELGTGRQLSQLDLSTGYDEHSAWPIYSEPFLWISGPFRGGSQLLEVAGGDSPSLKVVWKKSILSNDILSSVLVDGAVYGFDVLDAQAKTQRPTRGHFRCIDLLTGHEHWSVAAMNYRDDSSSATEPRIGHASVIVADGKLFLFNDTGELILARATTARYEELGRAKVLGGEIVWTPPTLHRGRLYLRNQSRAVCVFVGRPELLAQERRQTTLKVRDIPQQQYRDWAGLILRIEPEYAFDLPSDDWFRDWYAIALVGVFLPALILAGVIRFVSGQFMSRKYGWVLAGTIAFTLGAVGTTIFSHLRNDFVFTWPACLFVSFVSVVSLVRWRRETATNPRTLNRFRSYLVVAAFLGVCLTYFLVCRRLSLVFEWAFLAGFPAALPFVLLSRWFAAQTSRWRLLGELLSLAVAFTAFYWSSVALLWMRY